jgi:hypothetical protein
MVTCKSRTVIAFGVGGYPEVVEIYKKYRKGISKSTALPLPLRLKILILSEDYNNWLISLDHII